MSYYENLTETMINANKKALKYGCGKAWDRVKAKTQNRYAPRGKMRKKLLEWDLAAFYRDLEEAIGMLEECRKMRLKRKGNEKVLDKN